MARSEIKTDWLGNKYIQHYDDAGNEIGRSEEKTDWTGNKYIQHYDNKGNETGRSKYNTDWLGDDYIQHYDKKGNESGSSKRKKDWLGNEYTQHYDNKGRETERSEKKKDWLGNEYTETTGDDSWSRGSSSTSSPTSSGSSIESWLVKLLGYLLIALAIIWLVFAVAIPLILINIATIALIAGLSKSTRPTLFFATSVFGAVLIVVDYNLGWFTTAIVSNVSFFDRLIPFFYYLNVTSGLIATYFLIRNYLNSKRLHPEEQGEFSKRNLVIMGGLLFIGVLTIGIQKYFDHKKFSILENFYGHWRYQDNDHTDNENRSFDLIILYKGDKTDVYVRESDGLPPAFSTQLEYKNGMLSGNAIYWNGTAEDGLVNDSVSLKLISKKKLIYTIYNHSPTSNQVFTLDILESFLYDNPNTTDISGVYDLFHQNSPNNEPFAQVTIVVENDSILSLSAKGWKGTGRINGALGYFDWIDDRNIKSDNFSSTGQTTFIVNHDGSLRCHAFANKIDYWYVARRNLNINKGKDNISRQPPPTRSNPEPSLGKDTIISSAPAISAEPQSVPESKKELSPQFKLVTCADCNGRGRIQASGACVECASTGQVTCDRCQGQGKHLCRKCEGNKRVVCRGCKGEGSFVCRDCKGQQYHQCRECKGTGMKSDRVSGVYKCNGCGGLGKIPCYTCMQKGRVPCYTCTQTGYTPCYSCSQQGYNACRYCRETGMVKCSNCRGKGQVSGEATCSKCEGKGSVLTSI